MTADRRKLLEVRNLTTSFLTPWGRFRAVDDLSFDIYEGESLAVVGESGCGKSVTALSILRLIQDPPGRIESGQILFEGIDLLKLSRREMRKTRGSKISMIFQEPMTSLNPVFTVGNQIDEAILLHTDLNPQQARKRSLEMMDLVGIPEPQERVHFYPHQLSGGLRQRVMIAMALACEPKLLIADEPTTALDVTIQAQILELLKDLQKKLGMSLLMITHDFGVVAEIAERVLVMYAGKLVESAGVLEIFNQAKHPYTRALQKSIPRVEKRGEKLFSIPFSVPDAEALIKGADLTGRWEELKKLEENEGLESRDESSQTTNKTKSAENILKIEHLKIYYHIKRNILGKPTQTVKAVDDVSFEVKRGEILGLVGESGCGKSSLGKGLLRLIPLEGGKIQFLGKEISKLSHRDFRPLRSQIQMIFQDPYSSLNPRMRVRDLIEEPLILHRPMNSRERQKRISELLGIVGLPKSSAEKLPHEFSGGQRQRIGIARALAVQPDFLIADEPVSALDVSIQAQILNLLKDLKDEFGLTYLFVSHDLNVIGYLCDRVIVMNKGQVVEELQPADLIQSKPDLKPYTKRLLHSIPRRHPSENRV